MESFNPAVYPSPLSELMQEKRLPELGPGKPNEE